MPFKKAASKPKPKYTKNSVKAPEPAKIDNVSPAKKKRRRRNKTAKKPITIES
jgi:hypothetical protein